MKYSSEYILFNGGELEIERSDDDYLKTQLYKLPKNPVFYEKKYLFLFYMLNKLLYRYLFVYFCMEQILLII